MPSQDLCKSILGEGARGRRPLPPPPIPLPQPLKFGWVGGAKGPAYQAHFRGLGGEFEGRL